MITDSAIWRPIFDAKTIRGCLYGGAILIALAAVAIPSELTFPEVRSAFDWIAGVRYMASRSHFGASTAVAYPMALTLSPALAFATCFAKLELEPLEKLSKSRSLSGRWIIAFGCFLLMLLPFFAELHVNKAQISYHFFESVGRNRLALLLWGEGVFIASYFIWLWLLFESTNLVKAMRGGRT